MYRLYYSPGTASFAVHWMLLELGVAFEAERVDLGSKAQKNPDYLRLNPRGTVPTLVIDGAPYSESTALLMLLAERHPQAGLAPAHGTAERCRYVELMIFLANNLLPAFRNWFYIDDYATAAHAQDSLDHARIRIEGALSYLSDVLADGRPYLVGSQISAVDFLATMLCRWSRKMPRPAVSWPNLQAYVARMKARPSHQELYAREGLSD